MRVSECYDLSDNRLAFIAVFARIRACIYSKQQVCEKESLARDISDDAERNFHRFPPVCRRFLGELPLRHFGQAARTYRVQRRSG